MLRNYAKTSSDTLLSKVIGGMNHTGGKPFVDANSDAVQGLVGTRAGDEAGLHERHARRSQGSSGTDVTFADDQTVLAKAAVLFAGRNPTAAEATAVMNGGAPVLRETIRSYMTGPAFDALPGRSRRQRCSCRAASRCSATTWA